MARTRRKKSSGVRLIGALVCFLALVVAVVVLLSNRSMDLREDNDFQALAAQIATSEEQEPSQKQEPAQEPVKDTLQNTAAEAPVAETDVPKVVLPKYRELCESNPDFYGWIRIDDTTIDYPVMWREDDPGYYLNHAFDGSRSNSGTPFIGDGYSDGADNAILYGHHMKRGSMFAGLLDYGNQAFYLAHPVLQFDTIYQECQYEIFAVFESRIYNSLDEDAFRYYQYNGLQTEDVFNEFVEGCIGASLYDTGIVPVWGDKLVTLSTCSYHTQNGRFVVAARRIT